MLPNGNSCACNHRSAFLSFFLRLSWTTFWSNPTKKLRKSALLSSFLSTKKPSFISIPRTIRLDAHWRRKNFLMLTSCFSSRGLLLSELTKIAKSRTLHLSANRPWKFLSSVMKAECFTSSLEHEERKRTMERSLWARSGRPFS